MVIWSSSGSQDHTFVKDSFLKTGLTNKSLIICYLVEIIDQMQCVHQERQSNLFSFFRMENSEHLSKFLTIWMLHLHGERKWLGRTALTLAACNVMHSLAHYGSWQLSVQAAFITRHLCNGFFVKQAGSRLSSKELQLQSCSAGLGMATSAVENVAFTWWPAHLRPLNLDCF